MEVWHASIATFLQGPQTIICPLRRRRFPASIGRAPTGRYQPISPASLGWGLGSAARRRLSRFRQSTLLAVAVTGLALMLWGADTGEGQAPADTSPAAETTFVTDTSFVDTSQDVSAAVGEATSTLWELGRGAYRLAPKIGIAIALLIAVAFITRAVRALLRRASRSWQRAQAVSALASVVLWLLAIGAALAILAGDARALLGSVGPSYLRMEVAVLGPSIGASDGEEG